MVVPPVWVAIAVWSQALVLVCAAVHPGAAGLDAVPANWSSEYTIDARPVRGFAATPKSSNRSRFPVQLMPPDSYPSTASWKVLPG